MDCSPPGLSVHGILQARILEQAAISFSRRSSQLRDQTCITYVSCNWQAGSLPVAPPGKTITIIFGKYSGIFKLIFQPIMRNPHGLFNYVPISIITFTTLDRFHHILNSSFTIQCLVSPFFLFQSLPKGFNYYRFMSIMDYQIKLLAYLRLTLFSLLRITEVCEIYKQHSNQDMFSLRQTVIFQTDTLNLFSYNLEFQGWGGLVGCHLWGRTQLDTTEATQQQQQHASLETMNRVKFPP